MRKICFFTGARAEYSLLKPLMYAVQLESSLSIQLLVSGSHLADTAGATVNEIIADGWKIDERVEVLQDSGSCSAIYTGIGLGVMRYGDALNRLQPDMLVILGDRFEALAVATAALVCQIPIVHLHGGELTLGAMDDSFRHAITKMSTLHFTSTEAYRQRVIQLGESPSSVFNVGALGVENVRSQALPCRAEVENRLGINPWQKYFVVTFHPATLNTQKPEEQLRELLIALANFTDHVAVFTGANVDSGGSLLNRLLSDYVSQHPDNSRFFMSLGSKFYLGAVRDCDAVIGNSSSGVIEVPSLGVATVDIGDRQLGRLCAASVVNCDVNSQDITAAIKLVLNKNFNESLSRIENPYEKPGTSANIVHEILKWDFCTKQHKQFHDIKIKQ